MKTEHVVIAVLCIAILAALIFRINPITLATEAVTEPVDDGTSKPGASGPAYLVYNAPWGFQPPCANILPQIIDRKDNASCAC